MNTRAARRRLGVVAAALLIGACLVPLLGCDADFVFYLFVGVLRALFGLDPVPAVTGQSPGRGRAAKSAPVAAAPASLYLAAAAHSAGAQGTTWRSDAAVLCVGPDGCGFTVAALVHGVDNSAPSTRDFNLGAGQTLSLGDVLAGTFGLEGSAALRVTATAGAVVATDRTYNLLGPGNDLGLPAGATFGQYIPAVRSDDAIGFGDEGRLIQLEHSTGTASGFRTNLGLLNVSAATIEVEADLHRADSGLLGTVRRTLAPFEYRQLSRVFALVGAGSVADGFAVVRTTTPEGRFVAYASVVDNLTGDPVFVPAVRVGGSAGSKAARPAQYVVAAAHSSGAAGTTWRTDLELHNRGRGPATIAVDLLRHGRDNSTPTTVTLDLPAGQSRRLGDVLMSEFAFNGSAALRVRPGNGDLVVTSRTYNLLGAGNDLGLPAGATFGQFIPALTADEAIHVGEEGRLLQLGEDGSRRTNLALVNATSLPLTAVVELVGADGVALGSFEQPLAAFEYRQLNRVFTRVTAAAVADGSAVVTTTTDGGAVFALASVVDNLTGDPVGMSHAVVRPQGAEGLVSGVGRLLDLLGQTTEEGDDVTLEALADGLVSAGLDGLLDRVAAEEGGVTRVGDTLVWDFGAGTPGPNGSVYSGSESLDLSGLDLSAGGIRGTIVADASELRIDGAPADLAWTEVDVDLTVDPDGRVHGDLALSGGAANRAKSTAALSGNIVLDTLLCEYFPTGGSITLSLGDETTTVTFTPSCDGTFGFGSWNRWDLEIGFSDPRSADAQRYLESTENAEVYHEGVYWMWKPVVGGPTLAETPPGVVTYRIPFERPLAEATVYAALFTFHWSYSQGYAALYGSRDGATWELLDEAPPPAVGGYTSAGSAGLLPPSLLGTDELWIKAELYSYGPSAANGGASTNTAQLLRWQEGTSTPRFLVRARLED